MCREEEDMGMGNRKILKSEIGHVTKTNSVLENNLEAFKGMKEGLSNFIGESELQGKGWSSAKEMARIFESITEGFEMVTNKVYEANKTLERSQDILLDDMIDEQALKNRVMQNKATMTQLSYANSLWNSINPGKTNNSFDLLRHSIGNENAELQKSLDSLHDFDLTTKYLYDDVKQDINSLMHLLSKVSDISKVYDSKTGTFNTKGIDTRYLDIKVNAYKARNEEKITVSDIEMGKISGVNKESVAVFKRIAKAAGLSILDIIAFYVKSQKEGLVKAEELGKNAWEYIEGEYAKVTHDVHVSDSDIIKTITVTYVDPSSKTQHGITIVINETTGEIVSEKGWGTAGEFYAILSKYGSSIPQNATKRFGEKNNTISAIQNNSKTSTIIGNGFSEMVKNIVKADGINKSTNTVEKIISGKEYQEALKKAEEELKRKKEQQEREQHIKDMQNISNGGPGYFAH